MLTLIRPWSPPGPVAAAAFASWAPIVLIMGPPGSGKTGMLINKAIAGTLMQKPYKDGVARARLWLLCIDYRRLWGNFLPSWFEWLPQHDPANGIAWTGPRGGPAQQIICFRTDPKEPERITHVLEIIFEAVGDDWSDEAIEALVAGKQCTWCWLNEWQNMPQIVWFKIVQRVGRFPRAADAPVVGPGRWGDLNAGTVETFQHLLWTSGELREGKEIFPQPGAFDIDGAGRRIAENLKNLAPGYYERMAAGMPEHEYERKLLNRWGRSLAGEPVFTFDDRALVAKEVLLPDYRRALLYGVDAGLDPALVFGQRMADGQLRRLAEVVATQHGVGPKKFGEAVRAMLETARFSPFFVAGNVRGYADPSAFYGADKEDPDDAAWVDRFARAAGLLGDMRPRPAPSNLLTPRLQAVRDTLVVDEGHPKSLFDPQHCRTLRQAYNGGYRNRKLRIVGSDRYDPEPEKNNYSHVADADQYLAMMEGGYARAMGREPNESNAVMAMLAEQGLLAPKRPDGSPLPGRRSSARLPFMIP